MRGGKPNATIIATGEPVLFGLAVLKNFRHQELALSWVNYLIGSDSVATMKTWA
ncbi:hypothetical protein MUP77_25530 [Candidatus Bathyarchaeota archaeon]|nr:hypothetical protein [Candidatus Bathyarchaeota archaeon]